MRIRLGLLGLLVLLGATTGCSAPAAATPRAVAATPALPGYRPPAGAPALCVMLARSSHLAGVAPALGALAAGAGTTGAQRRLADAADDLRAVLTEARGERADAAVVVALEKLVAALSSASHGTPAADVPVRIRTGLDAVGTLTQPVCEFPS